MTDPRLESAALLSPCGTYRYWLTRTWDVRRRPVCFVMLNPSMADAKIDDPTIRRCIRFARAWGRGGIVVVNLYALRATNPRALWRADDPVGPDNDRHLVERTAGLPVVAAWGVNAQPEREQAVYRMIHPLAVTIVALRLTKGGKPGHPLYIPTWTRPVLYKV